MYCGMVKLDWDKLRSMSNLVQKNLTMIYSCLENHNETDLFLLGRHALDKYELRTACLDGGPQAFSPIFSDREGLAIKWPTRE